MLTTELRCEFFNALLGGVCLLLVVASSVLWIEKHKLQAELKTTKNDLEIATASVSNLKAAIHNQNIAIEHYASLVDKAKEIATQAQIAAQPVIDKEVQQIATIRNAPIANSCQLTIQKLRRDATL